MPKTNREIMKRALFEILRNTKVCTATMTLELGLCESTTEFTLNAKP